ncbi:hypothetical protein ACH4E8_06305 [Streptomyces sp. NPDC017979]|uniref:hypothetical protein n=1 Tax=Streptomyces sp. NPDC017979 TaxID=3365024 RepID=UPI0037876C49
MALQRAAGNAAVARAVEEQRHEHGTGCGHDHQPVQRAPQGSETTGSVQRITDESLVNDVLHPMRTRPRSGPGSIMRGAEDDRLALPPEILLKLRELSEGEQRVEGSVDLGTPGRRPSPLGGEGESVNSRHEARFNVGKRDKKAVHYIRFVKAAKINQGHKDGEVTLTWTRPGYVSWVSPKPHAVALSAPNDRGDADRAALNAVVGAGFAQAQWSYDGPSKEFQDQEKRLPDGSLELLNVDTPGLLDDTRQYPILQKFEFYGVLYSPQEGVLHVNHYEDTLSALSKTHPVTR